MFAGDGYTEDGGPEPLDQATLKKYILYAKSMVKPSLLDIDKAKVSGGAG